MERLRRSASAQRSLRFARLRRLATRERAKEVHRILRANGVRYVPRRLSKCHKTRAVLANLEFLTLVPGAASGYLRRLAAEQHDDSRARQMAKDLHYIKLKGSRDLMADLGLARNVIALDVRLLNLLRRVGARLPSNVQTDETSYRRVQDALLEHVARPAGVNGVQLDRILFNNYDEILRDLAQSDSRGQ